MFGASATPTTTTASASSTPPSTRGINFVDTADMYSAGRVRGDRRQGARGPPRRRRTRHQGPLPDGRRSRTEAATRGAGSSAGVEDSLRRLGTDWIDLYQVHRPDPDTDIEETLGALTDLVAPGKIRAFGCSTFPAQEIVEAHVSPSGAACTRFRTEQPPYSLLARGIERDVLPVAERFGMGVLTWSPLAFGFLTGKYRKGAEARTTGGPRSLRSRFDPAAPGERAQVRRRRAAVDVADDFGCTLPGSRIAFPLAPPGGHLGDHRPAHDGAAGGLARAPRPDASTTPPSTASTRSSRPAPTSTAPRKPPSSCRG